MERGQHLPVSASEDSQKCRYQSRAKSPVSKDTVLLTETISDQHLPPPCAETAATHQVGGHGGRDQGVRPADQGPAEQQHGCGNQKPEGGIQQWNGALWESPHGLGSPGVSALVSRTGLA